MWKKTNKKENPTVQRKKKVKVPSVKNKRLGLKVSKIT